MALQPSLNPIVSFFESITIFTLAARRPDHLYKAKDTIPSKSSTPSKADLGVTPSSKTADMEISYCQSLWEHHAGWRIAPAKVEPPVKRPAEKEEEALSHLLVLQSQVSFDDGHTNCASSFRSFCRLHEYSFLHRLHAFRRIIDRLAHLAPQSRLQLWACP